MTIRSLLRRAATRLAAALFLAVAFIGAPIGPGAINPAQAQTVEDFHVALEAYGFWQPHPRWGEVWVPYGVPRDWRPYSVGHWVYTDEWGWYWVSDPAEEAFGWITFHYGRWLFDRQLGWFWVPGEEWGPAWVNWRGSDDYVGWAPLPPDDVIYEYDDSPDYWVFVQPRYLIAPQLRVYFVPPQQRIVLLRRTVIVNRSFAVMRGNTRIAVNVGIPPQRIAFFARAPVPTFQVRPRVLAGTQGVAGAVSVRPADVRPAGFTGRPGPGHPPPRANLPPVSIQRAAVVQANTSAPPPPLQALPRGERGRLGTAPPRAAQGATVAPPHEQQRPQTPPPQAPQQQRPQQQPQPPPPQAPQQQRPQQPPPTIVRPGQPSAPPPAAAQPSAPPTPRQEERRPEPPRPPAQPPQLRPQNEPPPQARPERPVTPQAPPPPPPQARPAPPPQQARPPQPPPQPARPAPPPQQQKPPPKPGEKPEERK
ncbi:MAG TPA: DUF6600 domain-containing protein [Pseudolabrys sp.]|nr:DUF6600 domain-containing protein [Pseudolabrys sp.]